MATGVLLKAGAETGETLVGHADFQLSDDVVRKMHYGHFTLYSKTLVWKSDNIYLAENIVSTGYVRGNDTSFNTLETLYSGGGDNTQRSIYCAMVPISTRTTDDTLSTGLGYFNPMDITGRFSDRVPHMKRLERTTFARAELILNTVWCKPARWGTEAPWDVVPTSDEHWR